MNPAMIAELSEEFSLTNVDDLLQRELCEEILPVP